MNIVRRFLSAGAVFSSLSIATFASTYVVDDNPGPGVDFTSIQTAIDAAAPGDTLLVMPGQYSGFTLSKPIAILGQPPSYVQVGGTVIVQGIPAGQRAVLADLTTNYLSYPSVRVSGCAGTVVLDSVFAAEGMIVVGSADVRIRKLAHYLFPFVIPLSITASRVELVDSNLTGGGGQDLTCAYQGQAGSGVPAVFVSNGEVHIARCNLTGGNGGNATCADPGLCGADGGDGAPALSIGSTSRALVTGLVSHRIRGGGGGGSDCGIPGSAAAGIRVSAGAELRYSEVTVLGIDDQGGTVTIPTPSDISMNMLEVPHPGVNLTFRVSAPPGAFVRLLVGRTPTVIPIGGIEEDVLVAHAKPIDLGIVPASGILGTNFQLPSTMAKGSIFIAQATATMPGASLMRSHSIPIVVR